MRVLLIPFLSIVFLFSCTKNNTKTSSNVNEGQNNKFVYNALNNTFYSLGNLGGGTQPTEAKCFNNKINSDWNTLNNADLSEADRQKKLYSNDSEYHACAVNAEGYTSTPSDPNHNTPYHGPSPHLSVTRYLPFYDYNSCKELIDIINCSTCTNDNNNLYILNAVIKEAFDRNSNTFYQTQPSDKYDLFIQTGIDMYGSSFTDMFLYYIDMTGNMMPAKTGNDPMADIAYLESVAIGSQFPYSLITNFIQRPSNPIIATDVPIPLPWQPGDPLPPGTSYCEIWGPFKVRIYPISNPSDPQAEP